MKTTAPLQNLAAKSHAPISSTHAGLLLQRKCACGSPTASMTGECAVCKSKKRLQTKLSIGASSDPLEQEADRVAKAIVSGGSVSTNLFVGPPLMQRQEAPEKPREQPTQFPVQEMPKSGQEKDDDDLKKLGRGGLKVASELGKYLLDQFAKSAEGQHIIAALEHDWKSVTNFFEDFAGTISGKIALGAVGGAANAGAFAAAQSARETSGNPDVSPSTGGPVPHTPKDENLFGLEMKWDFVTSPTGLTLKTPWLDSPKVPLGPKAPEVARVLPPPTVPFKMAPKFPRICTPVDQQGDQGEADSRSAFIFWWLQRNRALAEKRQQEILEKSRLHAPPKFAPSTVQPLFKRATGAEALPDSEAVETGLRSSAQPLDAGTRTFMESRFGHDFSNVRIHADAQAARSAVATNALAFTVGRDVVFGAGRFAPGTQMGRQLLAHELTHVVQQSGADVVHAGQSTGNRGLSVQKRIMGSDPIFRVAPTVQRWTQDELLTAYNEALSRSDWNEVAVRLNGFSNAEIISLVGTYSKATLIAVKDAALTVMPGWNARVVRPVNARLANLMGSTQVLHASAKEIQDYLIHSPFLKSYVSSKFSGGNPLEGHIHIDDDDAFKTACIAYTMRQGKTREESEAIEPHTAAFREGDDIHVRKDEGTFKTTIHESMHRFSSPEYVRSLSNNANEGATEYFTRIICIDQRLTYKVTYPRQLKSTDLLVRASSKETVADAYFNGALPVLLTAVDTAKGAGTLRRWSEFMNTGSYELANALLN